MRWGGAITVPILGVYLYNYNANLTTYLSVRRRMAGSNGAVSGTWTCVNLYTTMKRPLTAAAACMATWTGWQRVRRCASVMYLAAAAAALTWRGEMEGWMDGGPASWLGDYWRSSMNDEMRFTPHFNLMPTVSPEIEIRSSTSSWMLRPVLTVNSSGWPFQELKTIAVTVQWIVITSFYKKAQLSLTKIVMLALVWRSFCLTAQFNSGFMQ